MRLIIALLLTLTLPACNIISAPATEEIVIGVTVNATTISQPTEAVSITNTLAPTETPIQVGDCIIPARWQAYTVASGDTLFGIGREFNSSVDELVEGNCLESANLLEVGQTLYVPSADANSDMIIYWLGSDNPVNSSSIEVGCETYLTPYESNSPRSTNPENDIRTALTILFNLEEENLNTARNHWNDFDLTVGDVTLSNGQANVEILGEDFLIGGVCSNPELSAQVLLIVFADPLIETAFITVGDMNLAQILNMSGRSGDDAIFTRDSLPDGF